VTLICTALWVYTLVLFARIILSWVAMAWTPPPSLQPAVKVVYDLTEPVLGFVRRYIPPMGGLDLSPLVVFLVISLVRGSLACG